MAKRRKPATVPPDWRVNVFGVRHLSPSGAWHLRNYLDQIQPDIVLIEGLHDADPLIRDITRKGSEPPIAILAYTESVPVRTLVYPFALYSPEYQAIVWAKENKADAEFIDLPSDIFLALQGAVDPKEPEDDSEEQAAESEHTDDDDLTRGSLYEEFARRSGEPDYDTYWERRFEHNLSDDSYRLAALEFGEGLRNLETDTRLSQAENLVREAFMRRRIEAALAAGHAPEKIVVVVGAYHAPVMTGEFPAITDAELEQLPRRSSKLTLMPYSYFRLSSQSGYGAGNRAPAYFELMWETLQEQAFSDLPARYLSTVARCMRSEGTHRSTAEVIEGVRLARTLAALKDGLAPTLPDLHDAATTLLGHGQQSAVMEAFARADVGTAIGRLPKGVSKTSIQDDFERELQQLKLTKYRTAVRQELGLDLRENRRAKSESAAFLDLRRSSFLHRLRILGISFAEQMSTGQKSTTWAERWVVQWTPESEIELVEAVLLGETVEIAAAYKFRTELEATTSVADAAAMVQDSCQCGMMKTMEQARRRLQELAAESTDFAAVAHAANALGMTARYGDVRRFDSAPLIPLIAELFVQGALALHTAANCDNETARQIIGAIDELNRVSLEYSDDVDEELWTDRLRRLADADDRNPLASGYACSILLERNMISNEELAIEVSRRLSPGIEADLGAGWFEGLAARNRYALLARQPLWEQLADYIQSLDDEQFRRALVFLRRAFGNFSPQEKRQITENLGEYWGVHGDVASELIEQPLTEEEEQSLSDLNDFDFDDL